MSRKRNYISLGNLKVGGSMGVVFFAVGIVLAVLKQGEAIGIIGLVIALVVFAFWIIGYAMYLDRKSRRRY
jgi:hypothetical protein